MGKLILDLCGGTGSWSKPYREAGYDVKVITLPTWDLREAKAVDYCVSLKPHGILCATPCEVWGRMGQCRWKERSADDIYQHALILVHNLRIIYETAPVWWAIENPPGKMEKFLGKPHWTFDPYHYGMPYHKKTHLWGRFTMPDCDFKDGHEAIKNYIGRKVGGGGNQEIRSITPAPFAKAFFEANP